MRKRENPRDDYETFTRKQIRALKTYFKPQYKELIFRIIPEVKKEPGIMHIRLNVDKKLEKVYGKLEFDLEYRDGVLYMTNNTYEDLLYKGYSTTLNAYKGIIYRDNRDLMKIKMLEAINE